MQDRKMWRMLSAAAVALAIAAPAAPAVAEVRIAYDTDGQVLFSIAAPDGWTVATGDVDDGRPRIIGLHPENDYSLWIGMFALKEIATVEEAEAYLKGMAGKIVQNAAIERVDDRELGATPARFYRGSGLRQGEPVDFTVGIAPLPSDRHTVIAIFLGENGAREVYLEQIRAIAASFKPE